VILNPTSSSESAEGFEAAALRAQAWYGEPFLHAGEDPAAALAPGTARRAALDDALAEMGTGRRTPSNRWRVRYGLMLGLERVLASPTPATAAGTELRRHQVDALAGMLTELIASNQRTAEENGNGNGQGAPAAYGAGQAQRASRPDGVTRTLTSVPSTIASICDPTAENPATLSASATACAKTASSTAVRSDSSVTSSGAIRRHPGVSRRRMRSWPSASSNVGSRGPVSFPISSW